MAVAAPIGARLEPPPPPPPPIVDPVSGRLIDPITRLPVAPAPLATAAPALPAAGPPALPPGVEPARIAPFAPTAGPQPEPVAGGAQPPEAAGNSPGNGLGTKLELGLRAANGVGAKIGEGVEQLHGNTAYTGTIQLDRQLGATIGGETKGAPGVSGSTGAGFNAAFEIVAPGSLTPDQRAAINPFDLRSLPPGASVKVDLGQFAGTEYEGQVRGAVASAGVRFEQGITYQAQRSADGKSADRAIGPYQMVEQSFGIGGELGPVTAQLGNTTQLRGNLLAKEKLDISGPENVSQGVTRTASLEYVSESGINLGIGESSLKFGLGENAGLSTVTQNPDGTLKQSAALYYGSAAPLTVERTFRPDGTEIAEQRSYSYTLNVDANSRPLLHQALGGDPATAASSPLKDGDTVVLRYDTQAMAALQGQYGAAWNTLQQQPFGHMHSIGATQDFKLPGLDAQTSFAVSLVRNGPGVRNTTAFVTEAFYASGYADGDLRGGPGVANPAEAWVVNPGQPPVPYRP